MRHHWHNRCIQGLGDLQANGPLRQNITIDSQYSTHRILMQPFRKTMQPAFAPICIIAVLVMSTVAMFPVWHNLFSIATQDEEASHILLVPVVFGWLL